MNLKFLAAAAGAIALSTTGARADCTPHTQSSIGLGWDLVQDPVLNVQRISKDGAMTNFEAYIALTKDGKRGAFVLLNQQGGLAQSTIGNLLLESLP